MATRAIEKISANKHIPTVVKQDLVQALRNSPKVYVEPVDTAALDSATLANSSYLSHYVEAGRKYLVNVMARVTNATAADGIQLGINVTGTQTSATLVGISTVLGTSITDDVAVMALTSGAYTLSDADSAAMSAKFEFLLIPQNNGYLTVQYAEVADAGAAGAVLKKGSFMTVQEVD